MPVEFPLYRHNFYIHNPLHILYTLNMIHLSYENTFNGGSEHE